VEEEEKKKKEKNEKEENRRKQKKYDKENILRFENGFLPNVSIIIQYNIINDENWSMISILINSWQASYISENIRHKKLSGILTW
jgi:hypothetical protein